MEPVRANKQDPRWDKVRDPNMIPFYGSVALGNVTQWKVGMFWINDYRLFFAIEGKGAYTFEGFVHYSYVMEKLGVKGESDARNIADFINGQLGYDGQVAQGNYREELCK